MTQEITQWLDMAVSNHIESNQLNSVEDIDIAKCIAKCLKLHEGNFSNIDGIVTYKVGRIYIVDIYTHLPHEIEENQLNKLPVLLSRLFCGDTMVYIKDIDFVEGFKTYGYIANKTYFERLVIATQHNKVLRAQLDGLEEKHLKDHDDIILRTNLMVKQVASGEETIKKLKQEIVDLSAHNPVKGNMITLKEHAARLEKKTNNMRIEIGTLKNKKNKLINENIDLVLARKSHEDEAKKLRKEVRSLKRKLDGK